MPSRLPSRGEACRLGASCALAFSFAVLGAASARAGNVSWISATSGNWSDGARWSGGVAPTAADTALIAVPGTYTVTLDVHPTVAAFAFGAASGVQTVSMGAKTLTMANPSTLSGGARVEMTGASFAGTGSLTTSATIVARGPGNAIANDFFVQSASTIKIEPSNLVFAEAKLTVANGFTNYGLIDLTDSFSGFATGARIAVTNGTLINAASGTVRASVGAQVSGTRVIDAVFDNHGTVDAQTALAIDRAGAAHQNSGSISVAAPYGGLTLTQTGTSPSFTHTGTISVATGRTFSITGGTFAFNPGLTSGAGDMLFRNATIVGMTLAASSARVVFDGGVSVDNVSLAGTLVVRNQPNSCTGTFTSLAGGTLRIEPTNQAFVEAQFTVTNGFTNNGTIELTDTFSGFATGSRLKVLNGTLINAAAATIRSAIGAQVSGTRVLDCTLDNRGILDVQAGMAIDHASAAHLNSGTVAIASPYGSVALIQTGTAPTFTHTGTISVAAGRTFSTTGGTFSFNPGVTSGTGDMYFRNATVVGLTLAATSARVVFDGGVSVDNVSLAGTLVVRNQPNSCTGTFTSVAGGTLRIEPTNQAFVEAQFTVTNGFINWGLIELTDSFSGYATGSRLKILTGTLINAATATIRSAIGGQVSGTRVLDCTLDNRGTVDAQAALALDHASAAHLNSGIFTIASPYGSVALLQTGTAPSFTHTGVISVAAGRTFSTTGGTFAFDPGLTNGAGDMYFRNATVVGMTLTAGSARTVFDGGVSVDNVSLAGTLVVRNQPNACTGTFTSIAGGTLRIEPSNLSFAEAQLTVSNGFTNNGLIELTDSFSGYATGARLKVLTGTLINAATATIRSAIGGQVSGTRVLDCVLDNRGTLDVLAGLAIDRAGAAHLNSGTITIASPYGSVALLQTGTAPSFTHTGLISVAAARTFSTTGGTFVFDPGQSSGAGDLYFRNVTIVGLTLAATSARTVFDGGVTVDNVTLPSTLVVRNQPNACTGTFTSVAGGTLRIEPSNLAFAEAQFTLTNGFINWGLIELTDSFSGYATGSRLKILTGTLINAATATVRSAIGGQVSGTRVLDCVLDNRGTVETFAPMAINHASAAHLNSGFVTLIAPYGDLALTQSGVAPSFTHTGIIAVPAGRTFTITGGAFAYNPGVSTGPGDMLFRNCAITGLTLTAGSARVLLDGSTTIDTASVAGTLVARTAPNTITSLAIPAGGLVRVEPGNSVFAEGQLTVNSPFTNSGTIDLTDSFSGYGTGSRFRVLGGTLVNAAGGTIKASLGGQSVGTRRLVATLSNHGTLRADGCTLLPESGPVVNEVDGTIAGTGTLDLSSVTFSNLGTVSPGASPGIFTVTPNLATAASGRHIIEIGGRALGSQYDRLAITNTATLGGTLDLRLVNGFVPVLGDSFVIVTASTVSGVYGSIAGRSLPNGLEWNVKYRANRVDLIAGTPLPNTWPAAVNDTVALDEDTFLDFTVLGNDVDPDGDTLHVSPSGFTAPLHGTVALIGPDVLRYVPQTNYNGGDSFTYTAVDNRGGSSVATVFVTVRSVNDAPVWSLITPGDGGIFAVSSGSPVGFTVEAVDQYDPSGVVTLTASGLPSGATMTPALPVSGHTAQSYFLWTPGAGDGGSHCITFTATDDSLVSITRTICIEVNAATAVAGPRVRATWTDGAVDVAWRVAGGTSLVGAQVERTTSLDAEWNAIEAVPSFSAADGAYHAVDRSAVAGATYWYRLAFTTADGARGSSDPVKVETGARVLALALGAPSPNPTARGCRIDYALPQEAPVRIVVLDVQGREVARLADGVMPAGTHAVAWDGRVASRPAAAGVYMIRLTSRDASLTRRLIVGR